MAKRKVSWLLSVEDLQAILRPQVSRFSRSIWPAWDRYQELPEEHRLVYDGTTEAGMLHCYMVQAAKKEFDGVPGIQFLEEYGFHLGIDGTAYGIDGLAVCRFKKFDEDGRSNNYPTERAEALRRNDEELPGIPRCATIVDVGYCFNGLRTGFGIVQAVRLKDSKLILSIPQIDDQSVQMPGILPFSPIPVAPRFEIIEGGQSNKKSSEGADGK
jgi:hypothetical protein